MTDKLMYNPDDDTQIYPFNRLQFRVESLHIYLNEPTNQNSIKVPRVFEPTKKDNVIIKLWGLV